MLVDASRMEENLGRQDISDDTGTTWVNWASSCA